MAANGGPGYFLRGNPAQPGTEPRGNSGLYTLLYGLPGIYTVKSFSRIGCGTTKVFILWRPNAEQIIYHISVIRYPIGRISGRPEFQPNKFNTQFIPVK
jgi:hypothetical protein